MKNNVCCRIFKEQIDLINQLPEEERGVVLLSAINKAFFHLENQVDNQDANQDDGHLLRYSVSISNSLSDISKAVLSVLEKSIRFTEFNANWGGKRYGSGRKSKSKGTNPTILSLFADLVISCFEPSVVTEEQKQIFMANNSDYLHDIFDYCQKDPNLAIIAINKCFAPLKREGMSYSYKAVLRNIALYYSQALKVEKHCKFRPEQQEIVSKIGELVCKE